MPRLHLAVKGSTWFTLLLLTASCAAQTAQSVDHKPAAFPPGDCLHRSVVLTIVTNPQNDELHASQLQVQTSGSKISEVSLSRSVITPRVVLLLDTSGSMNDNGRSAWATALLAAGFALDTIPPESPVALGSFSNKTNLTGFEDRKKVQERLVAVGKEGPRGQTALYAAVQRAIGVFGTPQFGDTIFLVTDTGDDLGGVNTNTLAKDLIERGIRLFTLIVSEDGPKLSPLIDAAKDFLQFSDEVGGYWLSVRITPKWLAGKQAPVIFKTIREQLQSPYRIDLQLAAPLLKPAKLKIKSELKPVELSYPRQIEPCSTVSATSHP